jgi:hypothetical protein
MPLIFWANHMMICKAMGYSPFYMAHSVEPILPFDIMLATFLLPDLACPMLTKELIAVHYHQLELLYVRTIWLPSMPTSSRVILHLPTSLNDSSSTPFGQPNLKQAT